MIEISLLYSRYKKTLRSNGFGGRVNGVRWEWGVGKGRWARGARRLKRESSLKGKFRTIYLLVGSRYSYDLSGREQDARTLYEYAG